MPHPRLDYQSRTGLVDVSKYSKHIFVISKAVNVVTALWLGPRQAARKFGHVIVL